jgi:hypothetical protein
MIHGRLGIRGYDIELDIGADIAILSIQRMDFAGLKNLIFGECVDEIVVLLISL